MAEKIAIKLVDLKKRFDNGKWITNGVNLEIPEGKMTVIIGRSGEGKSVLLKQVIGLLQPTSGSVIIDGVDITHLPPSQLEEYYKKMGYVFQFAALLDSLNVMQNIGITLLENGVPEDEALPIVKEKLKLVNLDEDTSPKYLIFPKCSSATLSAYLNNSTSCEIITEVILRRCCISYMSS